jgi:DNA repair exonuclease SbcCD ATPase subunit
MLRKAKRKKHRIETAQSIIQTVSEAVQRRAHTQIAESVTRCLQAVWGDGYEFILEFKKMRGKTVATPYFVKNGVKMDVSETSGGGLLDVTSFALRATSLILSRPARRRLLILDEPFRCVSEDLMDSVQEMVLEMSELLNIQFVIVTHNQKLRIGKIIQF